MARTLADPALHRFAGGSPLDADAMRARFERLSAGRSADGEERWHNWIVRLAETNAAVGTVQATVLPSRATAEVAWVVGVPWQGRGYAAEAAQALVQWLLEIGMTSIQANIHPDHAASEHVAARCGLSLTNEVVDGERVWRRVRGASRSTA